MTLIRRAILSLALIAGLPAFAAAPPPVPALPDVERRSSCALTASVGPCSVLFALYGDSTDYENWIEVYVNGVRQTGNWIITSPTGPLATIPRPINDAVLTFTAAQTGTVQIVGARRPRRTSQFPENRGVAARDFNQALTDIIAQNRETWDRTNDVTGRAFLAQPGNRGGVLPPSALCGGMFLGFAADGSTPVCVTGTGTGSVTLPVVDGNLACFSGTGGLVKDCGVSPNLQFFNYITAPPYNAKCDGSDDSIAIQAAIDAQPTYGSGLDIPKGVICAHGSTLDFKAHNYMWVRGGTMQNGNSASALQYTGTGARAYDFRGTLGNRMTNLTIEWSNAGFSGNLIDAGGVTAGVDVTAYFALEDSGVYPVGPARAAPLGTCLNLDQATNWRVRYVSFDKCNIGIHGQNILPMNVSGEITGVVFTETISKPIQECGEAWTLRNVTFERDINLRANAFQNSPSLPCKGMSTSGNWHGDVALAGGTWWVLTANGFKATADKMASNGGANVGYTINGGSGYSFDSGNYGSMSLLFDLTGNPSGIKLSSLTLTGIATAVNGTCIDCSAESNTPNISFPLPSWVPVLTPSTTPGAFAATINSATYRRSGNVTDFWMKATVTNASTGAGNITVTGLPVTLTQDCPFAGFDSASSFGLAGVGGAGGTGFVLFRSNTNYPGAVGSVLVVHGRCQTN